MGWDIGVFMPGVLGCGVPAVQTRSPGGICSSRSLSQTCPLLEKAGFCQICRGCSWLPARSLLQAGSQARVNDGAAIPGTSIPRERSQPPRIRAEMSPDRSRVRIVGLKARALRLAPSPFWS